MEPQRVFATTERELLPVLEELRRREPIFHSPEFDRSSAHCEQSLASDYWEVGASGRRYSREFILRELAGKPTADAEAPGWESWDHSFRRLGPDTYLMTYVLKQEQRITRRATIWRKGINGWMVLYHQGTIVASDEDDKVPS